MDIFNELATSMLQTGKAAEAFDLSKEPDKVRERYGGTVGASRTCSRVASSSLAHALSPR
jgi:hypothetical protein